ncbi:hypothetical protein Pyn_19629 [Prunus yedoensis var. nudiflora]|uniref:Uncharacterized protein n=1 Tax=Prunus yedoensis var. nudiflora TaxID=2094558 RepID=A0A314Z950_PRUYE|nr:hypothetical protein Pyn_19629 [Prunus yedoensis var. nudiflora]
MSVLYCLVVGLGTTSFGHFGDTSRLYEAGGRRGKQKPSSSEEPKPGLGVEPTKLGWPEGKSRPSSSPRGR